MRFGDENERNEKNKIGEVCICLKKEQSTEFIATNQMLAKSLFCRIGRRVVMRKALVMLYARNEFSESYGML